MIKTGTKILITGGAGFIGANFVNRFLSMGHEVMVAERKRADLWRLKPIKRQIRVFETDLANYPTVKRIIARTKPDTVIHLAAYGAYQRFQQDTELTVATNLIGTINLANACREIGVRCFINTGSSSEYGIKNKPMEETDILEPENLYGITKSAATQYCQLLTHKHGFPAVTIRPFAVYGPFEEPGRLITEVITACLRERELKLSNPHSVRDFIYIGDLIDGYLAAIKRIKAVQGEIFNLGSGKQHTIKDVVTTVKKITGSTAATRYGTVRKAQTEPKHWLADISKAKKMLRWRPKYTLEEGLRKDIEWFKGNLSLYD